MKCSVDYFYPFYCLIFRISSRCLVPGTCVRRVRNAETGGDYLNKKASRVLKVFVFVQRSENYVALSDRESDQMEYLM